MSNSDRLAELKQLAHDVRNALNGVAVNLEVARSRAQRNADVAQVAPFLETASQQLDAAARLHKKYSDIAADIAATSTTATPPRQEHTRESAPSRTDTH